MAKLGTKKTANGVVRLDPKPKNTRQGQGHNTKYSATSRNNARKPYKGQGK